MYSIIDLETTGVRPSDEIVEFACLVVDDTGRQLVAYDTIIDPQSGPGPTWLHGITAAMCREAPTFPEVGAAIHELLAGRVLVAHNLRFDWAMLRRAFNRAGASFLREAQGICTATLAREAGIAGGLQRVARVLGLEVRQPHRALDDAQTTRELWLRLRACSRRDRGQPLPPASGAHRLARARAGLSRTGGPSEVRLAPGEGQRHG
jgi:DNA polymerase-3 subunit epsilon